jgi:hypothetical protein
MAIKYNLQIVDHTLHVQGNFEGITLNEALLTVS